MTSTEAWRGWKALREGFVRRRKDARSLVVMGHEIKRDRAFVVGVIVQRATRSRGQARIDVPIRETIRT